MVIVRGEEDVALPEIREHCLTLYFTSICTRRTYPSILVVTMATRYLNNMKGRSVPTGDKLAPVVPRILTVVRIYSLLGSPMAKRDQLRPSSSHASRYGADLARTCSQDPTPRHLRNYAKDSSVPTGERSHS